MVLVQQQCGFKHQPELLGEDSGTIGTGHDLSISDATPDTCGTLQLLRHYFKNYSEPTYPKGFKELSFVVENRI
jgi:hypothetical protein